MKASEPIIVAGVEGKPRATKPRVGADTVKVTVLDPAVLFIQETERAGVAVKRIEFGLGEEHAGFGALGQSGI